MTVLQGVDPRTGAVVGEAVEETQPHELEAVLQSSHDAFESFASSPPAVRISLLEALAAAVDCATEDLMELAALETGLPEQRLRSEIGRTSSQLRLFAEVVRDGSYLEVAIERPDRRAGPPGPDLRRYLIAVGPTLVYAASNFPFAFGLLGGDSASALACGASLVTKAHPAHPGLSARIAELAAGVIGEQGLPPGLFNTVYGDEVGVRALRDRRIKACGFTGSTAAGRHLFDLAVSRPDPIPFYGELGSINPVIATPNAVTARGDRIAAEFVASVTGSMGQLCTKPGLLFLPVGHGLDAALAEGIARIAPGPLLNDRIHQRFEAEAGELAGDGRVQTIAEGPQAPPEGCWATPRMLATSASVLLSEPGFFTAERFGPVALVVTYDGIDEMRRAVETIQGSLTATVHAEPDDAFEVGELVSELRARCGRIIFNGWPTGVTVGWATQHGGPWPATTASAYTSVGAAAIRRWLRPVCFQSAPPEFLPPPLRDENPWGVPQRVDGEMVRSR